VIPVEDILEALDLSRAEPGSGFLEALFLRFNAKVPFENASKILRHAAIADPAQKPRTPEIFWADHLTHGTGGTCFARVAAFDALLTGLGYRTRRHLGKVRRADDHASLSVETPAGELIADVGFPLPALLPAGQGFVDTAVGGLRVEATRRGLSVALEGGVPEGPRVLEIFSAPAAEEEFRARWRETFGPPALFLQELSLRLDRGNRIVSYARGQVRVDDLHSRLRVPLPDRRPALLSEIFGVDADLLSRAVAIVGDPAPPSAAATLSAYLEVDTPADAAFAAIATAAGYRRLLEGVGEVGAEETTPDGFRLTLSAAGGGAGSSLTEEVAPDPSSRTVTVTRRGGASESRSSYRAETREGKTWLVRETALSGARDDLLRNDSMRGRLAGTLAVDLLAWARMLG
jgi:hypothetical protein